MTHLTAWITNLQPRVGIADICITILPTSGHHYHYPAGTIADRPTDFNVGLWSGSKLPNVIGQ